MSTTSVLREVWKHASRKDTYPFMLGFAVVLVGAAVLGREGPEGAVSAANPRFSRPRKNAGHSGEHGSSSGQTSGSTERH